MTDFLVSMNSLQIHRGVSRTLRVTVVDASGEPFDLTDYQVWFTVKAHACANAPVLIQKRSSADPLVPNEDIVVTSPLAGEVEVYLTPADTSLSPGPYTYDIWVVSEDYRYLVVGPATLEVLSTVTLLPL